MGKTIPLNRIQIDAEARGIQGLRFEAPEDRSLPGILAPALRTVLLKLDRMKGATDTAKKAMRALAGFVGAMKMKFGDVEVGIEVDADRSTLRHWGSPTTSSWGSRQRHTRFPSQFRKTP